MSTRVNLAKTLAALCPRGGGLLDNYTDCYFFHSKKMSSASPSDLAAYQLQAAEWRYQYEIRNRTLELFFERPMLESLLKDKCVLDFGCFMGGTTIAWMDTYGIKTIYGFDTEKIYSDGARLFAAKKQRSAEFTEAYGEHMPYDDESFDTILSLDVFEHVKDLPACLAECSRVLKPGGDLIAIFPPYYHPLEHHIKTTLFPGLHWVFGGETLRVMQNEMFGALGSEYDHFLIGGLNGYRSPYLNGITVRAFNRYIRDGKWRVKVWQRNGVPTMGESARRSTPLKMLSSVNRALAHMPILEEACLDRIAVILERPVKCA